MTAAVVLKSMGRDTPVECGHICGFPLHAGQLAPGSERHRHHRHNQPTTGDIGGFLLGFDVLGDLLGGYQGFLSGNPRIGGFKYDMCVFFYFMPVRWGDLGHAA
jgi:hypothetical protein